MSAEIGVTPRALPSDSLTRTLSSFPHVFRPAAVRAVPLTARPERGGPAAWRRALEDLPVWVVSAALCLLLAAGTLLVGTRGHIVNTRFDNIGPGALALGLMMLRDIALLHGFSFRPDQRRAVATTLVYIAVLDLLLPLLAVQLDLPAAVSLFRPDVLASPGLAIGVFGVHAALAFAFAAAMWRQRMRPQPSS